jgi:hypothetical protein
MARAYQRAAKLMKTIKAIDDKPTSFEDDMPQEFLDKMPTFRKLFRAAIGLTAKNDGNKALDLYQLGLKFRLEESDISIEDAEFNLLKEACNQNPAQWISHYHAQIMLKLKEAEK